jgi:hypothetical protein
MYESLIKEAPFIPGDESPLGPISSIPWLQLWRIERGIRFADKHFASLFLHNMTGLLFNFPVKPISAVVLVSGHFNSPREAFLRLLGTLNTLQTWIHAEVTKDGGGTPAFHNFRRVRALHRSYARMTSKSLFGLANNNNKQLTEEIAQNSSSSSPESRRLTKELKEALQSVQVPSYPKDILNWNPSVPFNQLDMALTQFAAVGLLSLFPQRYGIRVQDCPDTAEDLRCYIHLWALIGRQLGMEDRFNVCLEPNKELLHRLYWNVCVGSMKDTDERATELSVDTAVALGEILPGIRSSPKGWIHFGLGGQQEEGEIDGFQKAIRQELGKTMDGRDRWCSASLNFLAKAMLACGLFRILINLALIFCMKFHSYRNTKRSY